MIDIWQDDQLLFVINLKIVDCALNDKKWRLYEHITVLKSCLSPIKYKKIYLGIKSFQFLYLRYIDGPTCDCIIYIYIYIYVWIYEYVSFQNESETTWHMSHSMTCAIFWDVIYDSYPESFIVLWHSYYAVTNVLVNHSWFHK